MDNNTLAEVREALEWVRTELRGTQYKERFAQISQALAKLDALIEAQGWQPIETAKRDGTYILLHRPIDDHRQRRSVQEGKFHRYGMITTWRVSSGGIWDIDAPTHWMPLPKPPTQGDNDDE